MKIPPNLCVLVLCLASARARVRCSGIGLGIPGKRGEPGTELVVTPPAGTETWRTCNAKCVGLCQEGQGDWQGCKSFDMETWGAYQTDRGCKCYGYSQQLEESSLVDPTNGNHFIHYNCEES